MLNPKMVEEIKALAASIAHSLEHVKVEPWYISTVFTGYRVVERWERGGMHVYACFAGNIYREGSFEKAKGEAEGLARMLNAGLTHGRSA